MMEIFIDEEKCTGCGECGRVCPKGPRIYRIVEKNGRKVVEVIDKSFCIGCGNCAGVCRPGAIRLSEAERLSQAQIDFINLDSKL